MKAALLSVLVLAAVLNSFRGARILPPKTQDKKEKNTFYNRNVIECSVPFLSFLSKTRHSGPGETDKVKPYCMELEATCCTKVEVDLFVKEFRAGKANMLPHLAYIENFLNYLSSIDTEKLYDGHPLKAKDGDKEKDEIFKSMKGLKSDAKVTLSGIQNYFNAVAMDYSGLICQVCDNRFGSFFKLDAAKVVVSKSECDNMFQNELKFTALGSNLSLLLPLANSLVKTEDPKLKFAGFEELLKKKVDLINSCKEKEEVDNNLTDEEITKQAALRQSTDAGVVQTGSEDTDEGRLLGQCDAYCKELLPFSKFRYPFEIYTVMDYVHRALLKVAPSEAYQPKPPPPNPAIQFYSALNVDNLVKTLGIKPTGLHFFNFPLTRQEYQVVEVAEVEKSTMKDEELAPPPKGLSFGQKLYNIFFGWMFGYISAL